MTSLFNNCPMPGAHRALGLDRGRAADRAADHRAPLRRRRRARHRQSARARPAVARPPSAALSRGIDPAVPAMAKSAATQRERRSRVIVSPAPAARAADAAGQKIAVELRGATKVFGQGTVHAVTALSDLSVAIRENEFFTLLGPSGCGKTTLLRLIAGFEEPTSGEISAVRRATIDHLPPYRRPVNTVFQNYALFPHMTVAQNIAFGLQMLGREGRDRPGGARHAGARALARARHAPRRAALGRAAAARRAGPRAGPIPRSCCSTSRSRRSTSSCARRCRSS